MAGTNVPSNSNENILTGMSGDIPVRVTSPATARVMDTLTKSVPQTPLSIPQESSEKVSLPMDSTLISDTGSKYGTLTDSDADPRLTEFLHDDSVYQGMMRTIDREKIRMRLSIRYMIMMFAIFLVFAWIVSSRVIMFGFSEFHWLARARDALFAVMAGLFSLTIWFGSPTWFRTLGIILLLRFFALGFFFAVVLALYLPIL